MPVDGTVDDIARPADPAAPAADPAAPAAERPVTAPSPEPGQWPTQLSGRWLAAAAAGSVVVVAFGLALRFWTHSALWLDEALTVDIARLPLREIPSHLRRTGAPPLFYVLLHFWTGAFGTGNVAVRSLSGLFSVATLPVAWVAARRFASRTVAWVLVVVLASAPFAVYYATEARMYALVMLLTACGIVAMQRAMERPRAGNLAAVAVVTAALLYTQYWSVYLMGSIGLWLLYAAWRGPRRRHARWALLALAVGCLAFVPWLPTFLFQAAHTGTPWAKPANFGAIIDAVTGFADNQATLSTVGSNQGRLLAILYFLLAGLAVFGVARDRFHIDLDVRTRSRARFPAFVVVVTLAAAITGGIATGSAFSPRYAAVVFVPLLLLVAFGTVTFSDARLRFAVVAVLVAAGFACSVENIWTQRTQAPAVAAALAAHARPGDVVAFCPDQLGPAVYRLVPAGRYQMVTYPRGTSPAFVDWVDYDHVAETSHPAAFAARLEAMAGAHDIWLVSAPGYQGFGTKCQQLESDLTATPGYGAHQWVTTRPQTYYEPMGLYQFAPLTATAGRVTAGGS